MLNDPGAPERVPDAPRPRRIERGAARPAQQPVLEIRLEAGSVRPSEHRELGLLREPGEGLGIEDLAERRDEEGRIFAHRDDGDAARIVEVLVAAPPRAGSTRARAAAAWRRDSCRTPRAACRAVDRMSAGRRRAPGRRPWSCQRRSRVSPPHSRAAPTARWPAARYGLTRPACASPGAGPRADDRSARAGCGPAASAVPRRRGPRAGSRRR